MSSVKNNNELLQKAARLKNDLKMKQELENYFYLCLDHRDIFTAHYDYYMEFAPSSVKKIFKLMFTCNKIFRLLLIYCLFYHTVWWLPNSTSRNLAINYSNIDLFIFLIIIYYNFYHIIINDLVLRTFAYKLFQMIVTDKYLKIILNLCEICLFVLINLFIYFYLQYYLNLYSSKHIIFIMLPHLFFLCYNMFEIKITLFNYTIFSNQASLSTEYMLSADLLNNICEDELSGESQEEVFNPKNSNGLLSYTDCSNISISSYLNPTGVNVQNLTNYTNTSASQSSKTLKSRSKPTKMKSINSCSTFWRHPWLLCVNLSIKAREILKQVGRNLLNIPYTTQFLVEKRNVIDNYYDVNHDDFIPHKCQKDPSNLRAETGYLKSEFNNRLRTTFIQTFENIYFTFFIGRLCVPANINIREREYFVYLVTSTISTFISYWLYYMPLSFLVSLNRNSEHLGEWNLISESEVYSKWTNYRSYYFGDYVSYLGKSYKVNTKYCSARPGHKIHEKFYWIFSKPLIIVSVLLLLKTLCFLSVIILAYMNRRWYTIVINIMEVLLNSHTFFILCRDFFILYYRQSLKPQKFN